MRHITEDLQRHMASFVSEGGSAEANVATSCSGADEETSQKIKVNAVAAYAFRQRHQPRLLARYSQMDTHMWCAESRLRFACRCVSLATL